MSTNLYSSSKSYLTRKSAKQHQLNSLVNSNNKLSQVYATDINTKLSSLATKIPALNTPKRTHNNQVKNSLHFLKKKVNDDENMLMVNGFGNNTQNNMSSSGK